MQKLTLAYHPLLQQPNSDALILKPATCLGGCKEFLTRITQAITPAAPASYLSETARHGPCPHQSAN